MKQYNRSDHDLKGVELVFVGLASNVEYIYTKTGTRWIDLIQDLELGPGEYKLFKALAKACGLTEKQYKAIDMYYFQHDTISEIGAKVGISHQAVARLIKRGKAKLYPILRGLAETKRVANS